MDTNKALEVIIAALDAANKKGCYSLQEVDHILSAVSELSKSIQQPIEE